MDLHALRTFVEVSRRGSFAAVARHDGVDPSRVSRAVAGLEASLGVRLFTRTTRRLALTEAGEAYLRRVEPIVEELSDARDAALAVGRGPSGTLRMTASVSFGQRCIVPLLPAFREACPGIAVELLLSDQNLDLVVEGLDLAVRLAPSIEADLVCTRLFDTRYRVCASQDWVERHGTLDGPADLADREVLRFTLPGFRDRWLFRREDGLVETVPVAGPVLVSNAAALRDCMLEGLGPALLAGWLIDDDLKAGACVDLLPAYEATATTFDTGAFLIHPSRRFVPGKVRAAVDFLRSRLGERR